MNDMLYSKMQILFNTSESNFHAYTKLQQFYSLLANVTWPQGDNWSQKKVGNSDLRISTLIVPRDSVGNVRFLIYANIRNVEKNKQTNKKHQNAINPCI